MSWHKGKKELTEESTGDGKHGQKKRERLFKKRFSRLSLFSGSPKNKLPQGRSQLAEDRRRCWHRKGCKRPKEEPCPLRQPGAQQRSGKMCASCELLHSQRSGKMCPSCELLHSQRSGKMCPSCELLLCRPCGTLHSQRGFIAHSLLDHYDSPALLTAVLGRGSFGGPSST